MTETSIEREPCPICHENTMELISMECCPRCSNSLLHHHEQLEFARDEQFQPIIPSSVIAEANMAISSKNDDESGCFVKRKKKGVKQYYSSLNSWLDMMEDISETSNSEAVSKDPNEATLCVRVATYISFFVNICLLVIKAIALSSSSSYTLISSLADSCLDIIAGVIIAYTAANSKYTRDDIHKYPVGKSRVSTVGILVFSVLMSALSLFLILKSGMSLISKTEPVKATKTAVIFMLITVGVKLVMAVTYYCIKNPMTNILAEDHRNDVLTNTLGLFMYYGGANIAWWMDPLGGVLLAMFVFVSWILNAIENSKMLLGKSAPPDIMRMLTYTAAHHHPLILSVEQVIAFQIGPMYFTELHIIIPGHIPIEVAHWVGETLQLKIEKLPDIERAFVHVDCEEHNENEHISTMRATGKLAASASMENTPPLFNNISDDDAPLAL